MSNAPFSGTTYHAYKYRKVMFQRANGIVPIVVKKEVKLKEIIIMQLQIKQSYNMLRNNYKLVKMVLQNHNSCRVHNKW